MLANSSMSAWPLANSYHVSLKLTNNQVTAMYINDWYCSVTHKHSYGVQWLLH